MNGCVTDGDVGVQRLADAREDAFFTNAELVAMKYAATTKTTTTAAIQPGSACTMPSGGGFPLSLSHQS